MRWRQGWWGALQVWRLWDGMSPRSYLCPSSTYDGFWRRERRRLWRWDLNTGRKRDGTLGVYLSLRHSGSMKPNVSLPVHKRVSIVNNEEMVQLSKRQSIPWSSSLCSISLGYLIHPGFLFLVSTLWLRTGKVVIESSSFLDTHIVVFEYCLDQYLSLAPFCLDVVSPNLARRRCNCALFASFRSPNHYFFRSSSHFVMESTNWSCFRTVRELWLCKLARFDPSTHEGWGEHWMITQH